MIKYICDKCGKKLENPDIDKFEIDICSPIMTLRYWPKREQYHLCHDCMEWLEQQMEGDK